MIKTVLVDRRNWDEMYPLMKEDLTSGNILGLDIETHNEKSHEALKAYKKQVFDAQRTVVCGLSFYADGSEIAYYINLAHKDEENCVPWADVKALLDLKPKDEPWFIHNAPFEITMLGNSLGYEIDNFVCTLQMAVSAYNDDTYNVEVFNAAGLGDIRQLMPQIAETFSDWVAGSAMDEEQAALFRKVTAKETDASWSYNGLVKSVRYGFGLKEAVKSHFNYTMTTYEDVIGDKGHMGNLTGEEVADYGAEDAYWCVRLGKHLIEFMSQHGGADLITTYFEQELPAVSAYADVWMNGWKINTQAVAARTLQEQKDCAQLIRELKTAIKPFLPFNDAPSSWLMRESWYAKGYEKYRQRITDFANAPDGDDATIFNQISGSVSKSVGAPLSLIHI